MENTPQVNIVDDFAVAFKKMVVAAFAIASVLFLAIAVGWTCLNVAFLSGATRTTGTVIKIEEKKSEKENDSMYRPLVEYFDDQNQRHVYTPNFWTYPSRFKVGDQVEITYKPSAVDSAMINDPVFTWFLPVLFFVIGVALGGTFCVLRYVFSPRKIAP